MIRTDGESYWVTKAISSYLYNNSMNHPFVYFYNGLSGWIDSSFSKIKAIIKDKELYRVQKNMPIATKKEYEKRYEKLLESTSTSVAATVRNLIKDLKEDKYIIESYREYFFEVIDLLADYNDISNTILESPEYQRELAKLQSGYDFASLSAQISSSHSYY